MAKTNTVAIPKIPEPKDGGWCWVCNEYGSREYTSSVSEQDLEYLACGSCGCVEFHMEADE